MISFFSRLSVWYRIVIIVSVIWVIAALIITDPWSRASSFGGTYNRWGEFLGWGIIPVVAIWGIIWVVQGFNKNKEP